MTTIDTIAAGIADLLDAQVRGGRLAGAVAGLLVDGETRVLAGGIANLNTGQEFTPDTGFLLGSVTKVVVATAMLRLAERNAIDLDRPVASYVPEFTLRNRDAAEAITVRMLLNHTNGIDADDLAPGAVRGRDASRSYTERLRHLDVLFPPGAYLHYSNPGYVLAARILEEAHGKPFEDAIEEEILGPFGMADATAVQTRAFLRRTAVGAFTDPSTGALRVTRMFTIGESLAGGGSTLIVTAADMLAFARAHLGDGVAATGDRVLTPGSVAAMRTVTADIGIPQAPPMGLGWWLVPIAGTTALWHGGGSPGGSSSFCVLPEHDAAIITFVAGGAGSRINDLMHNEVIRQLTGDEVSPPYHGPATSPDPGFIGTYASFQSRMDVGIDDDELVVTSSFEPYDDEHRAMMRNYTGSAESTYTARYSSVSAGSYAPAGADPRALGGFFGRLGVLATVPAADGRRPGLHQALRFTPKVA